MRHLNWIGQSVLLYQHISNKLLKKNINYLMRHEYWSTSQWALHILWIGDIHFVKKKFKITLSLILNGISELDMFVGTIRWVKWQGMFNPSTLLAPAGAVDGGRINRVRCSMRLSSDIAKPVRPKVLRHPKLAPMVTIYR